MGFIFDAEHYTKVTFFFFLTSLAISPYFKRLSFLVLFESSLATNFFEMLFFSPWKRGRSRYFLGGVLTSLE